MRAWSHRNDNTACFMARRHSGPGVKLPTVRTADSIGLNLDQELSLPWCRHTFFNEINLALPNKIWDPHPCRYNALCHVTTFRY
ncbi:hypothetical protein KSC_010660 [Ktedonobacter sp. SOSP1-52]|nr:hypothetical protein KSC_010660 [Ktedonobacter sp. SOSP1-52]